MKTAELTLDKEHLSRLAPLSVLSPELLDELVRNAAIRQLPPGQKAFEAGDVDNQAVFLLSGQLALVSNDRPPQLLKAGSVAASQALEDHQPRQATALASTTVTILAIDSALLQALLDKSATHRPVGDDDVATAAQRLERALASPLFAQLPAPYLKVVRQRLIEIDVAAGATVIRQGEPGEHYYVITQGSAIVTRRAPRSDQVVEVADLGTGAGFGEESLIAHGVHNSDVVMTADGHLLRLSRGEFMTLIVRPLIHGVPYGLVATQQQKGAILLDVRAPAAFIDEQLQDSINLPLSVLRRTAPILDKSKEYIVCSDNPAQSATAAFLLAFQGIRASMLEGTVTNPTP